MDAVTEGALHEARHCAMAALLNVDVHDARITAKGGGFTNFHATDLDSLVKVISAGYWNGEHWPPSFPVDRGYDGDEAKLAKLCKQHGVTQPQWDALMR